MAATETRVLRDGSSVELIPMTPEEASRLLRFHHRLSPETTLRRFFGFHPELSPAEVHRFTHVDHVDREAMIAVSEGEIVAVGRFDRLGSGATEAEVAFVVEGRMAGARRGCGAHVVSGRAGS